MFWTKPDFKCFDVLRYLMFWCMEKKLTKVQQRAQFATNNFYVTDIQVGEDMSKLYKMLYTSLS